LIATLESGRLHQEEKPANDAIATRCDSAKNRDFDDQFADDFKHALCCG
jgi:hypothetical protein